MSCTSCTTGGSLDGRGRVDPSIPFSVRSRTDPRVEHATRWRSRSIPLAPGAEHLVARTRLVPCPSTPPAPVAGARWWGSRVVVGGLLRLGHRSPPGWARRDARRTGNLPLPSPWPPGFRRPAWRARDPAEQMIADWVEVDVGADGLGGGRAGRASPSAAGCCLCSTPRPTPLPVTAAALPRRGCRWTRAASRRSGAVPGSGVRAGGVGGRRRRFGPGNRAPLSFPMPGWNICVDFPIVDGLGRFCRALDDRRRLLLRGDVRVIDDVRHGTLVRGAQEVLQ